MCRLLEERSGAKSVEHWNCPSTWPYYFTHHNDVLPIDKRRSSISNPGSATHGAQPVGETGQLAVRSPGDTVSVAVSVTVAAGDERHLSVAAVPYIVATIGCLLLLLVVVGAASYATAAHSS